MGHALSQELRDTCKDAPTYICMQQPFGRSPAWWNMLTKVHEVLNVSLWCKMPPNIYNLYKWSLAGRKRGMNTSCWLLHCSCFLHWCMRLTKSGLGATWTIVFTIPENRINLMIDAREDNLDWFKRVNSTQHVRVTAMRQGFEPNKICYKGHLESITFFIQAPSNLQRYIWSHL